MLAADEQWFVFDPLQVQPAFQLPRRDGVPMVHRFRRPDDWGRMGKEGTRKIKRINEDTAHTHGHGHHGRGKGTPAGHKAEAR